MDAVNCTCMNIFVRCGIIYKMREFVIWLLTLYGINHHYYDSCCRLVVVNGCRNTQLYLDLPHHECLIITESPTSWHIPVLFNTFFCLYHTGGPCTHTLPILPLHSYDSPPISYFVGLTLSSHQSFIIIHLCIILSYSALVFCISSHIWIIFLSSYRSNFIFYFSLAPLYFAPVTLMSLLSYLFLLPLSHTSFCYHFHIPNKFPIICLHIAIYYLCFLRLSAHRCIKSFSDLCTEAVKNIFYTICLFHNLKRTKDG